MARKSAERSGMHVTCPFCGHLCDGFVKLSFCSGCYAEYWPQKQSPWKFTFTDVPTGKQAWAKSFCKAGGMSIGTANKKEIIVDRKFPTLDFGGKSPRQRGSEAFAAGLMRSEICDREFFSLVNANARAPGYTMKQLGEHRTAACREWIKGWDTAQKKASSPSRDVLFDGSDAHLLNEAGDAFESTGMGVGS